MKNGQMIWDGVEYEQFCQLRVCQLGERLEIERIPSDGRIARSIEEAATFGWVQRKERTDREFLEHVDNQLSGLIRQARYLRQQVQAQLGWTESEDVEPDGVVE